MNGSNILADVQLIKEIPVLVDPRCRPNLLALIAAVAALFALADTAAPLAAQKASTRPTQKIKIFAFAQQKDSSGFIDPSKSDMTDSIKDIREAITKKKSPWIELVEAREQADIVLELTERTLVERQGRATTNTVYSKDGKTATSTTTQTKEHDVVLKAVMTVGDYTNELSGVCDLGYLFGGAYRQAAKNMVGSLEDWVKANYTRLQIRKTQ